ncbi:uncharacterized protein LOC108051819 isoform X2 [Drosophila rhopaloa]|uniref:Uncharacterized protein LOC108051819 isoform X2 n=1 Tax=Drosophila rhopaloa TaxID=1041015 RepID=A0A6P4FHZ7_DRORH|nr:uncharacterized protein LOC108051819 isoform X2 [Drosophila rhopaloa]
MAHFVPNPVHKNFYIKDSVAYTEDHIPVRKLYIYNVSPELNQSILEDYFGTFGLVLSVQVFRPRIHTTGFHNHKRNVARYTPTSLLTGLVLYAEKRDAAKALISEIHHVNGSHIKVLASDSWHQPEAYGMPRDPPVMPPNTEPPPPPAIMILNDHCLEHILQYLSLADQVHFARSCLRFRGVYQMATPLLHKSVDWSQFGDMTVWDVRDFFELSGCHVQKLMGKLPRTNSKRLTFFLSLSSRNMHKIFSRMHKLETLELQYSNVKDDDLLVLRNLRSLKTLNLDGNDLLVKTLVNLPDTIESLSLNQCMISGGYLTTIGKVFYQLKELNILSLSESSVDYQTIIQDKSFAFLETLRITVEEDEKYELVAQLPSLKHLTIVAGPFINRVPRIHLFEQLVKLKAKQLEQLEIRGFKNLTREMLIHISKLVGLHTLIVHSDDEDNHLQLLSSLVNLKQFTLRLTSNRIADT